LQACGRISIPQDTHDTGACIRGAVGAGKTFLACALARAYVERHPESKGRFVLAPDWLSEIRSTFGRRDCPTEKAIIDRDVRIDVLVLDDLGAEKQTDFSAAALYTLLSRRINAGKVTFVTTNQTLSEIARWEPRIASRLACEADFAQIVLKNTDRRVAT